jgi:hypothetical protein
MFVTQNDSSQAKVASCTYYQAYFPYKLNFFSFAFFSLAILFFFAVDSKLQHLEESAIVITSYFVNLLYLLFDMGNIILVAHSGVSESVRDCLVPLQANAWATSKQLPGQFTGSTDVRILSQAELAGPDKRNQAWARKVGHGSQPSCLHTISFHNKLTRLCATISQWEAVW